MVRKIEAPNVKWTGAERSEVQQNIAFLYGCSAAREAKYNRNLNRFFNNGRGDARATVWSAGYQSLGYNRAMYDNSTVQTKLNLVKSVVQTVGSKLSQARVRPFFDAVQGDYKTIKATRAAQKFFDAFFDIQKVYERAPEVARGAMLFDAGHFGVDEDTVSIEPVPHWELFVDPYEANGGGLPACTYGMRMRREYPLVAMANQFPDWYKSKEAPGVNARRIRGEFIVYWDLVAGFKWYIWDREIVYKKAIEYKRLPFTAMWWERPVMGWSTSCLADDLYTIQVEIDEYQLRIDAAVRQSPFNTVFVPAGENGEMKATLLSNEAGLVVPYMPGPEGGMPVVATPAPISPEYFKGLEFYMSKGYELAGVSQLSAQSKKPSGVTSGIALQTLEDVESERHNVTVQSYIHQFVELAEIAVDVFPPDADVLPPAMGRARVKWSDVKKQRDMFKVQFSAGSALSKDPATKIDQIQKLQSLGLNLGPILPQLLEIPDLAGAHSVLFASYVYTQTFIEKAAEEGIVDFAPIADMGMLFREAVQWYLRLSADESNEKYTANLKKLIEKIQAEQEATVPPAPEPIPAPSNPAAPAPAPAPMTGGM